MSDRNSYQMHFSERDIPLVYVQKLPTDDTKIITVENYLKWYGLYVVSKDGVEKLQHNNEINFCDHTPVPADVEAFANKHENMYVDGESMDMMIGRYFTQVKNLEPEFIGYENANSKRAEREEQEAEESQKR